MKSLIGGILRSAMQISHLNDAHSWAATSLRGLRGLIVKRHNRKTPPRPQEPIELFEFEACPYCRKVRDEMTELDLSYVSRTCAKGAQTKRREVNEMGGKVQFPYLVDPNNDVEMYESEDIITYLAEVYGSGRMPLGRTVAPLNTGSAMLARRSGSRLAPVSRLRRASPLSLSRTRR